MKVLAVIVTPPTYKSSGGVAAGLALTRALVGKVEVEAAIMGVTDGDAIRDGLRVRQFQCMNRLGPLQSIAPRQLATMFWTSGIPAYIQRSRPDLVHIHNPIPPLALREVARTCRSLRIPYVISTHGFVEMTKFADTFHVHGIRRLILPSLVVHPYREAVLGADAICMLSPYERDMMRQLNVPDERLAVVTNGSTSYFMQPVTAAESRSVRERFHLSTNCPNFLFVGNHTRNKGLDILLTAMHAMNVPVRLIVAGAIRSPEEHQTLRQEYNVDGLGDRVVFTDHVTEAELRALYQSVDAFVFPTRADTLPLVIIEAMVSALPVIATHVGGIPYQVTPETGMLVDPEDPQALAKAMSTLASNPQQRRAMGEAGRVRAQELFDWDQAATEARKVYSRVLST